MITYCFLCKSRIIDWSHQRQTLSLNETYSIYKISTYLKNTVRNVADWLLCVSDTMSLRYNTCMSNRWENLSSV